jgi:hypothetical protein
VLVLAVDCMALIIGWVCIDVSEAADPVGAKFSFLWMGYLVFALAFLHTQRDESDFAMLRTLHKYTFCHLLLQSLFLFFDPLLQITQVNNHLTYLQDVVGLEAKNRPQGATEGVSVFNRAALLFAWIIVVVHLQKSKAYASMRLNIMADVVRSRQRIWLSFSQRLLERERALTKIERTLQVRE